MPKTVAYGTAPHLVAILEESSAWLDTKSEPFGTPLPATKEVELISAAIRGNGIAFEQIFSAHVPHIRKTGRGILRTGDLDDLVQEVFLTLFKRVHTLREPQALQAFVISITAHMIRYELRRKAALRWLRFGDIPDAAAADSDLDSREAVVRLYRILDRQGSEDRTVFTLRYLEGLELVDVSQALGVSLATTKRRVARAWRRVVTSARRDDALIEYVAKLGMVEVR